MPEYRLKMKIGEHEFEAEGPVETVQAQFAAFKELVENKPRTQEPSAPPQDQGTRVIAGMPALERIMKVENRVVSLTPHVPSIEDAVMLILTGQKAFRNNDSITGTEVMEGLRQSGHTVPRVDRILEKLAREGQVIRVGEHRSTTYRLSNQGAARGFQIARDVIAALN